MFKTLDTIGENQLTVLQQSCAAVTELDPTVRARLFHPKVFDAQSTRTITAQLPAERLISDGLVAARLTNRDAPPSTGPAWRPITRQLTLGDVHPMVKAPFPVICAP